MEDRPFNSVLHYLNDELYRSLFGGTKKSNKCFFKKIRHSSISKMPAKCLNSGTKNCSNKVYKKGMACEVCFESMQRRAEERFFEDGELDEKLAKDIQHQEELQKKAAEKRRQVSTTCVATTEDGPCPKRVQWNGMMCRGCKKSLFQREALLRHQGIQDPALKKEVRIQQEFQARMKEVNRAKKTVCSKCCTKVSYPGQLCAKHRAKLDKKYKEAEFFQLTWEVSTLRDEVLKQRQFLARDKAERKRRRRAAKEREQTKK